jgi:hypothetical protein
MSAAASADTSPAVVADAGASVEARKVHTPLAAAADAGLPTVAPSEKEPSHVVAVNDTPVAITVTEYEAPHAVAGKPCPLTCETHSTPGTYSRDMKYYLGKQHVSAKAARGGNNASSRKKKGARKGLPCFSPPATDCVSSVPKDQSKSGATTEAAGSEVCIVTEDRNVFQARGPQSPKLLVPSHDFSTDKNFGATPAPAIKNTLTPPPATFMARALPSFAAASSANGNSGSVTLRMDQIKQTATGIGFSNAFWTTRWHYHADKNELYRLMFQELQPSIIRLRNVHDMGTDSKRDMGIDLEFLQSSRQWLSYTPDVLLTSWTPPTYLKADGQLNGGRPNSTMSKDAQGRFKYDGYSQWWLDSINVYNSIGIKPRWVSRQRAASVGARCTLRQPHSREANKLFLCHVFFVLFRPTLSPHG